MKIRAKEKRVKGFWLLIFFNPALWWSFLNLSLGLDEFSKIGEYFAQNMAGIFGNEKIDFLLRMRSISSSSEFDTSFYKRLLFNKGNLVIDSFFTKIEVLSPKIYFANLNQQNISDIKVEFIPVILLPFWFRGLISLIKKKNYKLIVAPVFWALLVGVVGKINIFFLLPIILLYLYYCYLGINEITSKSGKRLLYLSLFAYSLFISLRMFLL